MRSIVCIIAGALSVTFLLFFVPAKTFLPKGIALPAKIIHAPISPESVIIYHSAPNDIKQSLGKISVEQGFDVDTDAARALLFQKVKQLAAEMGANGVVINYFSPGQGEGMGKVFSFMGTAVYVHTGASQ